MGVTRFNVAEGYITPLKSSLRSAAFCCRRPRMTFVDAVLAEIAALLVTHQSDTRKHVEHAGDAATLLVKQPRSGRDQYPEPSEPN